MTTASLSTHGGISGTGVRHASHGFGVFPRGSRNRVGVSVMTSDPVLRAKLVSFLGGTYPFFASGGTLTCILVGPDGL